MIAQEVVTQAATIAPSHSHAVVTIWLLAVACIGEAIAIGILVHKAGGLDYIGVIPITPLRSLVAIILFPASVLGTGVIGFAAGVWPPEYVLVIVMGALTTWSGLEIGAVWLKRKTTDATMPTRQNVQSGITAAPAVAPPAQPTSEMPIPNNAVPVVQAQPAAPNVPPRPDLGVPDKGVL